MSKLTILIIRHAEKPLEAWPGPGLSSTGVQDPKSLVVRGWQRAGSWAALFGTGLGGTDFPRPSVIYAANPASAAGDDPSQRAFETVTPLAARLGPDPVTTFGLGQEADLVAELNQLTGVVLVCWEHKAIAKTIVPALAGSQHLPGIPAKWDSSRFDPVLRFDRDGAGQPWSFRQLLPCLLSGDSGTPMP